MKKFLALILFITLISNLILADINSHKTIGQSKYAISVDSHNMAEQENDLARSTITSGTTYGVVYGWTKDLDVALDVVSDSLIRCDTSNREAGINAKVPENTAIATRYTLSLLKQLNKDWSIKFAYKSARTMTINKRVYAVANDTVFSEESLYLGAVTSSDCPWVKKMVWAVAVGVESTSMKDLSKDVETIGGVNVVIADERTKTQLVFSTGVDYPFSPDLTGYLTATHVNNSNLVSTESNSDFPEKIRQDGSDSFNFGLRYKL